MIQPKDIVKDDHTTHRRLIVWIYFVKILSIDI
jgi:hypothetical protein